MTDIAAIPQNGTARPRGAADRKRKKGNDTMAWTRTPPGSDALLEKTRRQPRGRTPQRVIKT
jgi:hypothetical protein